LPQEYSICKGKSSSDLVRVRKQSIVFGRLISEVQRSQHVGRAANWMYHSQVCRKFFKNVMLSGLTDCNWKDRIRTAIAKNWSTFIAKYLAWSRISSCVCRATNGARTDI